MTHQYESEILNKLMERDGFNIPSSVPPYEAEIKAYLINQVKQAYPKLTDYEAEWLLYNYTKHLPAEFPISSVSNVTEASFENVVPFAYQSAILKGQTLVNLLDSSKLNSTYYKYDNGVITVIKSDGRTWEGIDTICPHYKLSTTYTVIVYDKVNISNISIDATTKTSKNTFTYVTGNDSNKTFFRVKISRTDTNIEGSLKLMILEGDYTNEVISYFEGMQSVKMPVPTGKNLFDKAKAENGYLANNDPYNVFKLNVKNDEMCSNYIRVKPNTEYVYSIVMDSSNYGYWTGIYFYSEIGQVSFENPNRKVSKDVSSNAFITPNDCNYIRISSRGLAQYDATFQLEQGSTPTSYEPYQSSILTTTGKNLFDGTIVGNYYVNTSGDLSISTDCYATDYIKIKPNTNYSINNPGQERTAFYDENKNFITSNKTNTFLTPSNAKFLRTTIKPLSLLDTFQLEEGSVATPYEPYQSSIILTVNEDVTLRGIGKVKDKLNLLTGELTQRIGEIIFDGSEDWRVYDNTTTDTISFRYTLNDGKINTLNPKYMCDNFSVLKQIDALKSKESEWTFYNEGGSALIFFNVLRSKLPSEDLNGWRLYLQANPITIQYELATESVKTVDLTTVTEKGETTYFMPLEGTMNVQSSGENIQPTFDMAVPVEATTQNLASFIDLEMEE